MLLHKRANKAFSLMELMVVVIILGVLATIVVPRIRLTSTTAEQRVDEGNRAQINSAIERYYVAEGDWPTDLNAIANDANYFPQGVPANPVTGLPYTMNATKHRVD